MKEISIEEKAKRYDEAIERAKSKIKNDKDHVLYEHDIIELFPELAESEDEKIIEDMIETIKTESKDFPSSVIAEKSRNWLAWLEKQKVLTTEEDLQGKEDVLWCIKQAKKHAKDENEMGTCWFAKKWLEKQGTSYTKKDVDDAYLEGVTNTKYEIEKQYEATYQIRKDIATFIFNYRGDIKDRAKWIDYLGIKVYFVEKQGKQKSLDDIAKEVTKDKDAAVSFLKSTGIINENGELADEYKIEQGEQKFSWSEEDKKMSRFIGNAITADDASTYLESKGIQVIDAHVWLDELKDRVQLKQEWSEEDGKIIIQIKKALEDFFPTSETDKIKYWLNSLKDRVQPQPNQEWSDVDKDILFRTIDNLKFLKDTISTDPKYAVNIIDIEREITWLKSLRPQNKCTYNPYKEVVKSIADMCNHYGSFGDASANDFINNIRVKCKDAKEYDKLFTQSTWKPSEEQIKAVRLARSFVTDDFDENPTLSDVLVELEKQLKKLREE